MNQRIQDLLADAKLFCYNDGTVALLGETYAGQPEIEKFAELIVRQCMAIATGNGSDFTAKDIAEHFGVEE